MRRSMKCVTILLVLVVATLLSPITPALRWQQARHQWAQAVGSAPARAEVAAGTSLFLPVVDAGVRPPAFTISQPGNGAIIGGMLYFAIQPLNLTALEHVTFLAGEATLGTDTTSADGYRVFLNAAQLPAGPLKLTARATGAGGTTEQSINVTVASSPPAGTTVGPGGAVLATSIGSVLTIPPNGLPEGASVSVTERSQEEVTAEHGIAWEDMGVTFLGAQELQSPADLARPLGVASAGFGNRVQPGQAVVNYRIIPDADGDGVDELVVINTASVAPNNDVISDPLPQVALGQASTPYRPLLASTNGTATVSGPPGTILTIPATGLNASSWAGNVVRFESDVDGTTVVIPAPVRNEPSGGLDQTATVVIPPLPAGPATLTLLNASTGDPSEPLSITVEPSPPLDGSAAGVIDTYLSVLLEALSQLQDEASSEELNDALPDIDLAITKTNELRAHVLEVSQAPTPEEEQALNDLASMFQNSNLPTSVPQLLQASADSSICDRSTQILTLVGLAIGVAAVPLALGPFLMSVAGSSLLVFLMGDVMFAAGAYSVGAAGIVGLLVALGCYEAPPKMCPGTAPSTSLSDYIGEGARINGAPDSGVVITGMGGAFPPGGEGCGNAPSLPAAPAYVMAGSNSHSLYSTMAGRIVVRILTGQGAAPFSGVTDAGGYFYIPMIPQGQPFTAVAYDTLTGQTRTVQGTGPAIGDAVVINFDFLAGDSEPPNTIQYGEVISGSLETSGEVDIYSFTGTADEWVLVRALDSDNGPLSPQISIFGPDNATVCSIGSLRLVQNQCRLREDGLHTLLVADQTQTNTGNYRLYLDRPSDIIAGSTPLALGEVVTGTGPVAPAMDAYSFTASVEPVLVRLLSLGGPTSAMDLQLFDSGSRSFCLASGGSFLDVLCPPHGSGPESYSLLIGNVVDFAPYRLFVQRTADPVNTTAIGMDLPITHTIALAPDAPAFTFTGSTGDEVVVTMEEVDWTILVPELRIFRPDGTELCSRTGLLNATRVELPCTLDTGSGQRYTIIAGDQRGTGEGTFTLLLEPSGQ